MRIDSLRDIERAIYKQRVGDRVTLILELGQQQQRVELELEGRGVEVGRSNFAVSSVICYVLKMRKGEAAS